MWRVPDWRRAIRGFAMLLGLVTGFGLARREVRGQQQGAASGGPVGAVTGHVIAQDTQRPMRFAQVMLQNVASASGGNGKGEFRPMGGPMDYRTDADGNFYASNVSPGDYYVTGWAQGYIPERALLQAKLSAGATPEALLAQIPVVHVTPDSVSSAVVTIERGATVAGRVLWEDGSPGAGLVVRIIVATGDLEPIVVGNVGQMIAGDGAGVLPGVLQGIQSPGGQPFGVTDDRGGFRITGLAPGNYLVAAMVTHFAPNASTTAVYPPGVFRKGETKAITVTAGEERNDVRLVIDLRGLHTVSGHVTSSDPNLRIASGRVTVADLNDHDLRLTGTIGTDGSFAVRYVPSGTYGLQVSGASTRSGGGRERDSQAAVGVLFQPASQAVTVTDTDVNDVAVTLTPVQSSQ